ncbi:MAG TPA: hypothetical protein VEG27_02195 [Usitatibacter sp.]|nr:hypothetical protein [Usitatibacter sp.]
MMLRSILLVATMSACLPAAAVCTSQPDGTTICSARTPIHMRCVPPDVFDLETRQCRAPTPAEVDPGTAGACTLRLVYQDADPSTANVTVSPGCSASGAELALSVADAKVRWASHGR